MSTPAPARKMFASLSVRDLEKSVRFFRALGFSFNPKFTDEKAACLIINEDAFVMLLQDNYFRSFAVNPPSDAATQPNAIFGTSCNSREEVNELVRAAINAGGSLAQDPQDHGFMYAWSFRDLDGFHWEAIWMNPAHLHH